LADNQGAFGRGTMAGYPGMNELAQLDYDPKTCVFQTEEGGKVFYETFGEDMQVLHCKMSPGMTTFAFPGSMLYMEPAVKGTVDCNNCCGRCLSCHPCCMPNYTNKGADADATVAISPLYPMKIVPLKLDDGRVVRSKKGSYLASVGNVRLGIDFDCNPLTCCCGGQGCVRQYLKGVGVGFLGAMGTIMVKTLGEGEVVEIDTHSVVAWDSTVKLGVKATGGICVMCCGGEGMFNTTMTGPGTVYMQSYSYEKYQKAMQQFILGKPKGGGGDGLGFGAPEAEAVETEAMVR